ncbi:MAG: lipopolysaccharide assembly protein LapB [Ketobacteraceae bacterium]|nr:lipopolysaccharide assembly protein LapB [Ketobacteraceae bacterium]
MADLLVGTLLFLAIVIGWFLGKLESKRQPPAGSAALPRDYFRGVNLLLNEKQDEAMEVFLKTLQVSPDTVDTYLVMGSLFRRRGEVDRAIRIHQDLLARPSLSKEQQATVRLELSKDYLKAGLFDRSERLLKELVDEGGQQVEECLEKLLSIYEQEKEWQDAVNVAQQLLGKGKSGYSKRLSHYYCELAQGALELNDRVECRRQLKKALQADKSCVRASLIQAKLELSQKNYKEAVKVLRRVRHQDPDFIPEVLDLLEQSYDGIEQPREFTKYLFEVLEEHPAISIVIKLAEKVSAIEDDTAGAFVLSEYLKKRPSVKGLNRLIEYHIPHTEGAARDNLSILQAFTHQLIQNKPRYRCVQCGFDGKRLHWHCPSCKEWGTVKPIHGLEGE